MKEAEEEKLKRLQLGLAQTSVLFRAGCALIMLPFLLAMAAFFAFILYAIIAA